MNYHNKKKVLDPNVGLPNNPIEPCISPMCDFSVYAGRPPHSMSIIEFPLTLLVYIPFSPLEFY